MVGSSRVRAAAGIAHSARWTESSRARKLAAAALCAASFLAGELLLGADAAPVPLPSAPSAAPQTIWNQYLHQGTGDRGRESGVGSRFRVQEGGEPNALRPAAIQPIENPLVKKESGTRTQEPGSSSREPKRIDAQPLELAAPLSTQHAPRNATEGVPYGAAADESLPPIVPAAAMPRRPKRESRVGGRESGDQSARAPWMQEIRSALTETPSAELGTRSAEPNPKSKIQNPKSPHPAQFIKEAQFTQETQFTKDTDDGDLFTIQQPAQPAAPAPLPAAEPGISPLPEGSPFEAVTESGTVTVRVRRSLLMRTKVDIYRTAVVDETVCDIVQFTPREISLIGRAQGTTHVTFWFDDPGTPPLTYLVKVEPDGELIKSIEYKFQMLEDLVNEQFPDSKIKLVVLADKLLVKGQAKDSEEAAQIMTIVRTQGQSLGAVAGGGPLGGAWGGVGDAAATGVIPAAAAGALANQPMYQIVNMLRVPGVQQVALRVKIAELNRTAARGFGVNVRANIEFGDAVNGSKLLLASLLNTQAPGTNTGGGSVIANISGDDASIGIRYLQQHGVIRLLSEPTLVTLSGKPATFIAGGEFAVPTIVGSVGLNAVTTDFRAFGAIISFLPTVVDKDRIRLQVAPEFSQINTALTVGGTPGLNVRAATTTVEMREGQTLAIAGLLEDNYKGTNVGDLPFLAKCFGRRDASRNETELIILVTPELVHPLEPEEVPPLPGFDVTEPTNAEFFLHGDIEGHPSREYRSTVWPRLRKRYGGPAMTSGPFGHGQ